MNGYIEELRKILTEEQVTVNGTLLEQHSHDESYHTPHLPDMVIYPRDTAEVSAVMRYANEHEIPVIPFGLGSSLEGHVVPVKGEFPGFVLDESNIGHQGK